MPSATKTAKTTLVKKEEARHDWYVVDGDGQIVGRFAAKLAQILMGKHKPTYTPHVDTGDYVIVVNADKVRFGGKTVTHPDHPYLTEKMLRKEYDRYTGYPGGRRVRTGLELWQKHPTDILREAVRRMLPKNSLARHMLDKLKLYVGPHHPHQSQQPKEMPQHLLP